VNVGMANPVGAGLVASLARPGGNITGMSTDTGPELSGKRLELLKATAPALSRIAVLWSPEDAAQQERLVKTQEAARALGVTVQSVPVGGPNDLDDAFEAIARAGVDGLAGLGSPFLLNHRVRVAEFALQHGLPSVQASRAHVEAGVLMAYGPSLHDLARRSAAYVGRILKGTKPADLPVEQPREFEFLINLRTAQALGLTIPHHVLLQATEVIQYQCIEVARLLQTARLA
jgi:putative tryptophan/tyrosine transport system substrate-binding protein